MINFSLCGELLTQIEFSIISISLFIMFVVRRAIVQLIRLRGVSEQARACVEEYCGSILGVP